MENTKNKLSDYASFFLDQMSHSLDTKLYFYGSVQRYDYYDNQSDIDIDIFADNVSSMKYKLSNFLSKYNDDKEVKFNYFILKTKYNKIIKGCKVSFKNKQHKLFLEINIFDEKYKQYVIEEHVYKTNLPIHIVILFSILKFFHYRVSLLSVDNYRYLKTFCLNYLLIGEIDEFVRLSI
jgi:hypothetical protein